MKIWTYFIFWRLICELILFKGWINFQWIHFLSASNIYFCNFYDFCKLISFSRIQFFSFNNNKKDCTYLTIINLDKFYIIEQWSKYQINFIIIINQNQVRFLKYFDILTFLNKQLPCDCFIGVFSNYHWAWHLVDWFIR